MPIKLRDIRTKVIEEKDDSYAMVCSALGVCSIGETPGEAKKNFEEVLKLHLYALMERAIETAA